VWEYIRRVAEDQLSSRATHLGTKTTTLSHHEDCGLVGGSAHAFSSPCVYVYLMPFALSDFALLHLSSMPYAVRYHSLALFSPKSYEDSTLSQQSLKMLEILQDRVGKTKSLACSRTLWSVVKSTLHMFLNPDYRQRNKRA